MKPIRSIVLILSVLFLFHSMASGKAWAFKNEPTGFRGIKWGDKADNFFNPYPYPGESEGFRALYGPVFGREDTYISSKRKNDKMKIGDIDVFSISYWFYKNQFYRGSIMIGIHPDDIFDLLKDVLFKAYGKRDNLETFSDQYVWRGEKVKVKIVLYRNSKYPGGELEYFYLPILKQKNREIDKKRKKSVEKGVKDLLN